MISITELAAEQTCSLCGEFIPAGEFCVVVVWPPIGSQGEVTEHLHNKCATAAGEDGTPVSRRWYALKGALMTDVGVSSLTQPPLPRAGAASPPPPPPPPGGAFKLPTPEDMVAMVVAWKKEGLPDFQPIPDIAPPSRAMIAATENANEYTRMLLLETERSVRYAAALLDAVRAREDVTADQMAALFAPTLMDPENRGGFQ